MDKEAKKEITSLLPNCNNTNNHNNNNNDNTIDDSPKKPLVGHSGGGCGLLIGGSGSGNGGGDRLKRDEWSEGAVSCLLEAYESKWILRNRAKLKGHDWEDVAKYVSSRASCTKSPKTQTQCKNKIESMKKRYRSESAAPDASSWPLFPRLDLLLRGSAPPPLLPLPLPPPPPPPPHPPALPPPMMLIEPLSQSPPAAPPLRPPPPIAAPLTPVLAPTPAPAPVAIQLGVAQNSHGSNGVIDRATKGDHGMDAKMPDDHASDKTATDETGSSTPEALYSDKEKLKSSKNEDDDHQKTNYKKKRPRKSREDWPEVAESIRWLAEVVVRSEQARVDTMRELEKMRAEAEAKRGEIDLKRTEIIANTQLEIARLFAGIGGKGAGVDPSLRIGRS